MEPLWKMDTKQAMARLVTLWNRQLPDQICADFIVPNPVWQAYTATKLGEDTVQPLGEACECLCVSEPQTVLEICDASMAVYQQKADDGMPQAIPTNHYSAGVVGGLLGGRVKFIGTPVQTWSASEPMLDSYDQANDLRFIEDGFWARSIRRTLERAAQHSNGRYGLRLHSTIDGLNLAVELRGATRAYLDIHDNPEGLRRLMAFGLELNIAWKRMEQAITYPYNVLAFGDEEFARLSYGGTPWNSVDAYSVCAAEVYRDLGLEFHQAFCDAFGGMFLHTHGQGVYRLLPELAKLQGLLMLEVGSDRMAPDDPLPVDNVQKIQSEFTGDTPLMISCSWERFIQGLSRRSLGGGVLYIVDGCPSVRESNRVMPRVRDYVAPQFLILARTVSAYCLVLDEQCPLARKEGRVW